MILGDHFHMTSYFLRHLLNIPTIKRGLQKNTLSLLYYYILKHSILLQRKRKTESRTYSYLRLYEQIPSVLHSEVFA